jgi:hypothetical protein
MNGQHGKEEWNTHWLEREINKGAKWEGQMNFEQI